MLGRKNYIYHERQESLLCGQHCVNNLLQGPYFNAVSLSQIALELDQKERQLMGRSLEYKSANVDDSGNFSIQVLKEALAQHRVVLEPWFQRSGEVTKDPTKEKGFIINRSHHWLTVRRLHGQFWNLNSSHDLPEPISTAQIAYFMAEMRDKGYSIFSASGNVRDKNDPSDVEYLPPISTGRFYEEKELMNLLEGGVSYEGGGSSANAAPPEKRFQAFEGKARRLDGREDPQPDELAAAGGDDELQLALALSMSMEPASAPKVSTKEEMRAKRLAALSKSST